MENKPTVKILVVEDENIVSKDIQNSLQHLGYSVPVAVSSGEEAIAKATELRPDLVLMDILLKGKVDGISAAEQIRARLNIPVIYLTAYADEQTLQRAKVTEPFGYILKPFEERELHTTIQMALYKHEAEARMLFQASLLTQVRNAVIATDLDGKVIYWNRHAEVLYRWQAGEVIGKNFLEMAVSPENRKAAEEIFAAIHRTGHWEGECVGQRKDGSAFPAHVVNSVLKDNNGNVTGFVGVSVDLTEKKKMEEEMQKMQRLESLGVLAGGIAHDFNNILTGIMGNISYVKLLFDPEDEIYKTLGEADEACFRAKALTQQLLTFAKGGAPVKKTINIGALVKEVAAFALHGSNVRGDFSMAENLWRVEADPGQISQVIQNLVINAQQAMPKGGTIHIQATNENINSHAAHGGIPLAQGNYIKIIVADEGIGIPEDLLPKIFDPYFTTKQKGSGLGLATVYSILRRHGGYITVKSRLGVGTSFEVYLPATTRPSEEPALPVPTAQLFRGAGRILVMDDEEVVRQVLGKILRRLGYEVDFALTGQEAIEKYERALAAKMPYDIVIMDLTIPGGAGGREVIEILRKKDPQIRAIVASGYSIDPILSEYKKHGFRGAVNKPFRVNELLGVIQNVMRE
jgi:PAS domain S-box-containing protein